jgi:hypothetical protein
MQTLPWFMPSQVERSTSNFLQGIGVPEFFDPATGRFTSQSQLAIMEPATQCRPTADPVNFRSQQPTEDLTEDPVYNLRVMLDRLNGIQKFEDNWDSYGAQSPSDRAVTASNNLVWNVIARCFATSSKRAIPYSVLPLSGAGVQMEWRGITDSIEVEVSSDGKFGYLLTRNEASPARYREERDDVSEGEILRLVASTMS